MSSAPLDPFGLVPANAAPPGNARASIPSQSAIGPAPPSAPLVSAPLASVPYSPAPAPDLKAMRALDDLEFKPKRNKVPFILAGIVLVIAIVLVALVLSSNANG
nr:MAG: hypothetical protein DIU78_11665 [Pseudomonadota bacterium]